MGMASIDNRHKFDTFVMYSKSMVFFPSANPTNFTCKKEEKKIDNFLITYGAIQAKHKKATTLA